ncbi:hypothetical protein L2E82_26708 [Cichorium intybus]|uniref:Uncharacterized protein n=1 Tax=Cichorium intybus TaxID=13427 RepID=A0ACB9CQX6_CICIN|nr:hypothetical protein L2E82_26708 [Cichorium intybus]
MGVRSKSNYKVKCFFEGKAIKEDETFDNKGSLDRDTNDESGERPTHYGLHSPNIDLKNMKPCLREMLSNQEQSRESNFRFLKDKTPRFSSVTSHESRFCNTNL